MLFRSENGEDGEKPARGGAKTGTPDPEEILWRVNGAALRTLSRSGIEYLAFRRGDQVSVIPTENLLAGWAYNELKSRGTAGRRFDFTLSMGGGDQQPRWQVAVGEQEYELGQDELAPMYMPGAENGTAELLNPTRAGKR